MPHYTNAEEPFLLMTGDSDTAANILHIGGGSGAGNAATTILFLTAANTTTTTGTERMRIDSAGNIQIANTTLSAAVANSMKIGSVDLSAGNTMLALYGEGTSIGAGTPTADTTIAVQVNGTTYYILASTLADAE